MTWRHLNFFQHQAWLHARASRTLWQVRGQEGRRPWASAGSGLTLLFEALVMAMVPSGDVLEARPSGDVLEARRFQPSRSTLTPGRLASMTPSYGVSCITT